MSPRSLWHHCNDSEKFTCDKNLILRIAIWCPLSSSLMLKDGSHVLNIHENLINNQGLTLSIWFTCPSGTWFWKLTCSAKIFTCPANICTSPVKLNVCCWENKYMPWLKKSLAQSGTQPQKFMCPGTRSTCPGHADTPWCRALQYHGCWCHAWLFASPGHQPMCWLHTVEPLYNTIVFHQNTHKRHPIARP